MQFGSEHLPSMTINSCEKAESAFYAYLLCQSTLETVLLTLYGEETLSVRKTGFGYPTLLCLTGQYAGWIWDEFDDIKGVGGVFWRRPLMAEANAYEAHDVSQGFLWDKQGKNISHGTITAEMGRLIFHNCLTNYLDNLLALVSSRGLDLNEEIFRANVDAYTIWHNEFVNTHRRRY